MKKNLLVVFLLIAFACNFSNQKIQQPDEEKQTFVNLKARSYIREIPSKLNETSGLIYFDNLIWTLNDSGGENKIYGFNRQGNIQKEIEIKDADNNDWESICEDKKHIYIGDFGNNSGQRKNQRIYIIDKKDIGNDNRQKVSSDQIKFTFKNQKTFWFLPRTTPFDCEAMINYNDNIYLFTKDWSNRKTTLYKMPDKKGEYELSPIDSFNVDALITGAAISSDKKTLFLVGYKMFKPILWIFDKISEDKFFTSFNKRFELDEINGAQTEGICVMGNDTLLISCEQTPTYLPQVFFIDLNNTN